MSKDSSYSYIHMKQPRLIDLFEEFNGRPHLGPELIDVPPKHQPLNPEDEDDVVPDQHAAFSITRATQAKKETAWKDLGLEKLVRKGPGEAGERSGLKGMVTDGTGIKTREGLEGGLPR